AFDKTGTARASRSLTEYAAWGLEPDWRGWEAECARVRSDREAVFGTPCLYGRLLLGIFWLLLKGKPVERRGRKTTGLKQRAMTAGLPAKRKFFRGRRGSPVLTGSCARSAASPAVTEGLRMRPERTA